MDTVKQALLWIGIGAATSPIWGALLWVLWQGLVRPRLIPRSEIDSLAADMLARHGPMAEEAAFAEEDRAWRESQTFERGKWRRVQKRIFALAATPTKKEDCAGWHSPRNTPRNSGGMGGARLPEQRARAPRVPCPAKN